MVIQSHPTEQKADGLLQCQHCSPSTWWWHPGLTVLLLIPHLWPLSPFQASVRLCPHVVPSPFPTSWGCPASHPRPCCCASQRALTPGLATLQQLQPCSPCTGHPVPAPGPASSQLENARSRGLLHIRAPGHGLSRKPCLGSVVTECQPTATEGEGTQGGRLESSKLSGNVGQI